MLNKLNEISSLMDEASSCFILTGSKLAQTLDIPDFRQAQVNSCASCTNECHSDKEEGHSCHNHCQEENLYRLALSLLQKIKEVKPAAFHHLLAQLEQMKAVKGIITENVDSLHHLAGSQKIYELAGSLRQAVCNKCRKPVPISVMIEKLKNKEMPPKCSCGGDLQPTLTADYPQTILPLIQKEMQNCDLLVIVGSDLTDPLFSEIIPLAKKFCIINNENTAFDKDAAVVCHGPMEKLLEDFTRSLSSQFCLD